MEERAKAEERIGSFQKFGWKLGLERMRTLCGLLGDPQDRLNVIHVAGTNGKGSVCRYLYEVLLAHGHTVGLFTSPGLGDFRSRIESNGAWISEDDLERCTDRVIEAVHKMDGADPPTEFEVLTAVAFVYFERLDFVILEVGLGGSADSTNIVDSPLVSVITEIGFDHMEHLGDTIAKIAREKAGIIKPGRPVVTSSDGEAAKAVAKRAHEFGSSFMFARAEIVGDEEDRGGIRTRILEENLYGTVFSSKIHGARYDDIEISMPGRHQVRNAVCALAAFNVLMRMTNEGRHLRPDAALYRGMKAARLPGRFQLVSGGPQDPGSPIVILDGAHNPAGAAALRAAASALLPGKRILALIAMLRGKQADVILEEIRKFAADAVFTGTSNERGMDAAVLSDIWSDVADGKPAKAVVRDPCEAYAVSLAMVREGGFDALVVCGSLYMLSDIIPCLEAGAAGPRTAHE